MKNQMKKMKMIECIEWLQKVAPKGYKSKHSENENKKIK